MLVVFWAFQSLLVRPFGLYSCSLHPLQLHWSFLETGTKTGCSTQGVDTAVFYRAAERDEQSSFLPLPRWCIALWAAVVRGQWRYWLPMGFCKICNNVFLSSVAITLTSMVFCLLSCFFKVLSPISVINKPCPLLLNLNLPYPSACRRTFSSVLLQCICLNNFWDEHLWKYKGVWDFTVSLLFTFWFYTLIKLQGLVKQDSLSWKLCWLSCTWLYRPCVKYIFYCRRCHLHRGRWCLLVWATEAVFWAYLWQVFFGGLLAPSMCAYKACFLISHASPNFFYAVTSVCVLT